MKIGSISGKDMDKSRVSPFLTHGVCQRLVYEVAYRYGMFIVHHKSTGTTLCHATQ